MGRFGLTFIWITCVIHICLSITIKHIINKDLLYSTEYFTQYFLLNYKGGIVEYLQILFSWAPKLLQRVTTAMKLKNSLLLGRKPMTNLDSILKSRDITLPIKVHITRAMIFPVVMYECESWTIKKVERQRIDAFELWCWKRLLRVPWTERRSNQSILKE